MGKILNFEAAVEFEIVECANCGIRFAVTSGFKQRRKEDHKDFFCPSGHSNFYPQASETERLRKQLEAEKRGHKAAEHRADVAREEARFAEYRRRAAKAQLTKMRKRVANGVCPCCNRSFDDLHRHMKAKHPKIFKELGLEEG